jgi:hypothetical protein
MASYANFLGRHVTVSYRVSDILLPASGKFVGDSGRSIFLEQHLEQRGRLNYFRWEIPYHHIFKITVVEGAEESTPSPAPDCAETIEDESPTRANAASAGASAGPSALLPRRPKTA